MPAVLSASPESEYRSTLLRPPEYRQTPRMVLLGAGQSSYPQSATRRLLGPGGVGQRRRDAEEGAGRDLRGIAGRALPTVGVTVRPDTP